MDRFTLAAIIIVALIFLWGFYLWTDKAYAETFEDVIRIPIPDNVVGQEKKSQLTAMTDSLMEFTITYRFHIDGNFTAWREEVLLEEGITPPDVTLCPDRFYLDEDGITCYPIATKPPSPEFIIDKPKDLQKYERQLEHYQDSPPKTYDDMDEMRKLEQLIECKRKQGIENTLGIQNKRSFYISEYEETARVPKAGDASPIDIAIQECIAQLEAQRLAGRGEPTKEGDYLSAQDFFGSEQLIHQERAIVNEEEWQNIFTHETYPSPKQYETARDIICNSDRVVNSFKRLQEPPCTNEQLGISLDQQGYDVGNGREQGWYNTADLAPLDRYDQYILDKGETQRKMLEQAKRDEITASQIKARQTVTSSEVYKASEGWDMCPHRGYLDFEGTLDCEDVRIVCDIVNGFKENCRKVYGEDP